MKKYFLLLFALLILPAKAQGQSHQFFDPDYCWSCLDSKQHFAAGVVLDIAARGPFVAKTWHDQAYKRVLLVTGVGATYELMQYYEAKQTGHLGQPGYGFGPKDLVLDMSGAIVTEIIIGIGKEVKKIF